MEDSVLPKPHQCLTGMTTEDATNLIHESNGQIITVEFIKRTTGERRVMNCRTNVRSYLKGGELAYNPEEKGLVIVFDMQKKGYRAIPTESIKRVTFNGQTVLVS